jgi:hypothetical protein
MNAITTLAKPENRPDMALIELERDESFLELFRLSKCPT